MTNFFQNMASKFSKSKKEQNSLKNADDDPAAEQITPEELHQHFQNEEYFNQENVEETPDENVAKNVVTDEPEPLPVYEFDAPEKKSHWLRNTFLLLFFLIVIGVGAGYYYISNIDWNQHKDKIATEFMNFTGKKIVFEGPVHLTILPSPNLQAEKIKIYDPKQKKADPLAEIKSLVVDLTLPALLKGDFDVKMMSLLEPKINLEINEAGEINWNTPLSDAQRQNLENMEIALDSVVFKNATINFSDEKHQIHKIIDNINAEVIAETIFGPYRIEGTYVKNNNPEGFAFSIGRISNGLSTNLNLVLNQPSTQTFVRFDGSVLLQNEALNGNVIFESKQLMNFINSNFDNMKLKPAYDYPLAVAFDLKSNKAKAEISNFVVKYGQTAGAGNLLVPMPPMQNGKQNADKPFRPKVEFAFNFTNLDMTPLVSLCSDLWNKYKDAEAEFKPDLPFDMLADVKAVKSSYKNQAIKEFNLSFDLIDNKITLNDLSAVLPGDAAVKLNGKIYSSLNHLTYELETSFKTDEFRQMLAWLDIQPAVEKDTLLRRVYFSGNLNGNLQKIGVAPFSLQIDKSLINGEMAAVLADRVSLYAALSSDMVNLDDYIAPLPKDMVNQSLVKQIDFRFMQLAWLNDINLTLKTKFNTIIWGGIPYQLVDFDADLQESVLTVNNLSISDFANAKVSMSGYVGGFGERARFNSLNVDFATSNISSFLGKIDVPQGKLGQSNLKKLTFKSLSTGNLEDFSTQTTAKLEDIDINFEGKVFAQEGAYSADGNLKIKSPDFVKMVKDLGFDYEPKAYVLGFFNMNGTGQGNLQKFDFPNVDFNIGPNTFSGSVQYDGTAERKFVSTALSINQFELDKFFYNVQAQQTTKNNFINADATEDVNFIAKPIFDNEKLNYDFLRSFDFQGSFGIANLSYKNHNFADAMFDVNLSSGVLQVDPFSAKYLGHECFANFKLDTTTSNPLLSGKFSINDYDVAGSFLDGKKYGLKNGKLSFSSVFVTKADSFAAMFENLRADADFTLKDAVFKGWNFAAVLQNLTTRETSDGLTPFIYENLQNGEEEIARVEGKFSVRDEAYALSDLSFSDDDFSLGLEARGSVSKWTIESLFTLKYSDPSYLPAFSFAYSGSLQNPSLSVDAENLAAMYNQRQAKFQAQKEAELKAEKEKRLKTLNDDLLQTQSFINQLDTVLQTEIESKKAKANSPEIRQEYENLEKNIASLKTKLSALMLLRQNPNLDDALLQKVKNQNLEAEDEIENLKKEMGAVSVENLNQIIENNYRFILNQKEFVTRVENEIKEKIGELNQRLAKIETTYSLSQDDNFSRLKTNLQGNLLTLSKLVEKVETQYADISVQKDEGVLNRFAMDMAKDDADARGYVQDIVALQKQLFDYADQRVEIAEQAYAQKQKEEEIKRKLEENTGSISVKGTGVSKTVVRDLEDIEKSEQAIDNNTRVLDFSKKQKTNVIIRKNGKKSEENLPQSESSIVKKSDGEISKASGVIIKK